MYAYPEAPYDDDEITVPTTTDHIPYDFIQYHREKYDYSDAEIITRWQILGIEAQRKSHMSASDFWNKYKHEVLPASVPAPPPAPPTQACTTPTPPASPVNATDANHDVDIVELIADTVVMEVRASGKAWCLNRVCLRFVQYVKAEPTGKVITSKIEALNKNDAPPAELTAVSKVLHTRLTTAICNEEVSMPEVRSELRDIWDSVKKPIKVKRPPSVIETARQRVEREDYSELARRYDSTRWRNAITLCEECQKHAGTDEQGKLIPFQLTQKEMAIFLDIDRTAARRLLHAMRDEGILRIVSAGSRAKKTNAKTEQPHATTWILRKAVQSS